MSKVRAGVNAVDAEIVALLAKRFRFMDAAAQIKRHRDDVRDEHRKAAVIANVQSRAAMAGAPSRAVADVYEAIVEASITYELKRFDSR